MSCDSWKATDRIFPQWGNKIFQKAAKSVSAFGGLLCADPEVFVDREIHGVAGVKTAEEVTVRWAGNEANELSAAFGRPVFFR